MGLFKKNRGAVLAAILFCLCTGLVSSGTAAEAGQSPLFSPLGPQNHTNTTDANPGGVLYRMILAVSIVVALGVAALYTSKKVLPKFALPQGKKIRVLETVHLGSRKMVHLLEIGGQQILIGSTNDRITKLADILDVELGKNFPLGRTDSLGDVK